MKGICVKEKHFHSASLCLRCAHKLDMRKKQHRNEVMMKKNWRRWGAVCMAAILFFTATPIMAKADGIRGDDNYTPYLSLGADLKDSERATVLKLMGITEEQVENFDVIEVTNEEEKQYLGKYLDASVIGSRALSSVLVVKQEAGYGITVKTHNINYCTQGMYCNALITAGIENAQVIVAGPFEITGTAALVGAMEAYSVMTGEEITQETMDTAVNELVLTGNLAQDVGDSEKVEELMAMVKQQVAEGELNSPEEIMAAIKNAANDLNLNLTEEQMESVSNLMEKMSKIDIDVDALKEQAQNLYKKINDMGVDTEGIMSGIGNFFRDFFQAIADFFKGLF